MRPERYIGLMSGTSVDGVDAALALFEDGQIHLEGTLFLPYPHDLKAAIESLCEPGENEIDRLGCADRGIAVAFAQTALALLDKTGVRPAQVTAIGSHGQTLRHRPDASPPFTLQAGDPNTIAELTGITTVADFRRRDIAAGGQGAPLAPAFHQAYLGSPGKRRAVINIGGIANATLLDGNELLAGFDTGPGNTLLDGWITRHTGEAYDSLGRWASGGRVLAPLLKEFQADPYFRRSGPRSTGREYFNASWLNARLDGSEQPQDVQATLSEFTARSIAKGIADANYQPEAAYVCGGGAHNSDLMQRLKDQLPDTALATTSALGIAPDWVEAAAFAWLSRSTLNNIAGNAPVVTGASGLRILGGVYPGGTAARN